ncbi:RelA/SpoT domain-containing protein [Enterovibrio norvegicus]|uniref:RelA/SpoT domain-containing protein n=1 Tax=Enterovibrio norvegicus TaxID=188144 RepID=UPI000C857185|nr:RelA/SpoT domain-containing protein [Enterovibrio norvegicus]PMH65405.1 GTP pyrophosphokinase [Enterovibrio norvegicus]
MANQAYESQKVILRYSKTSIDRAARDIRQGCNGSEREEAINKIQNFRELHAYPLMLMKNHLVRTSNRVSSEIIVARRLKRLPTIINKLERPSLDGESTNAIKLTRMQDIGGCRAIVKNLKQLKNLQNLLEKSRSVHKIIRVSDYLTPKESGYGGVHLVYSCFDEAIEGHNWRKTKVEVQLRTQLQHAWATSLEIIDTLEQIELKTSVSGHPEWREFFSVAGQLVAHDEGAYKLLPSELEELQKRLHVLNLNLGVRMKLTQFSVAIRAATSGLKELKSTKNIDMCLVTLDRDSLAQTSAMIEKNEAQGNDKEKIYFNLSLETYKSNQTPKALDDLNRCEKNPDIVMCVLLSAKNAQSLKKAYPNYFGSTNAFQNFIIKHTKQFITYEKPA